MVLGNPCERIGLPTSVLTHRLKTIALGIWYCLNAWDPKNAFFPRSCWWEWWGFERQWGYEESCPRSLGNLPFSFDHKWTQWEGITCTQGNKSPQVSESVGSLLLNFWASMTGKNSFLLVLSYSVYDISVTVASMEHGSLFSWYTSVYPPLSLF